MMTLKIAVRNVFRNRRRSTMTGMTVAVGAVAALLLGALMSYVTLDFQTATVRRGGHLTVFRNGYFDFGAGNPSSYGIAGYQDIAKLLQDYPVLKPLLAVVTPYQVVFGLAGNYRAGVSKTFFGQGVVPADRVQMRKWNDYNIAHYEDISSALPDDPESGLVGIGLARILGLCEDLHLSKCPQLATVQKALNPEVADLPAQDFSGLGEEDKSLQPAAAKHAGPRLDLLAATARGAPNVVSLFIDHAEFQGIKEIDDNYIVMNLSLAQRLLYGSGQSKVTGLSLQLHHSRDLDLARSRINELIRSHNLDLEVRDFMELTPLYRQVIAFFGFLFTFFALIIGTIVLFTIANTMGMSVMERISEIGTMRAVGVQRREVLGQFLAEGCVLGLIGASLGVVLAVTITVIINRSGLQWTPPTAADATDLQLYLFGNPKLLVGVWLLLVLVATIAAIVPARHAARLQVIDALRHV